MLLNKTKGYVFITKAVAACFAWAVLSAVLMTSVAEAQQIPQRSAAPDTATATGGAAQPSSWSELPEIISLALNNAKQINLPEPVQNIVVGNETVANVQVDPNTPWQVFIVARAVGTTNIIFMDAKGVVIHQVEVRVGQNVSSINAALKELLPDDNIKASTYNDNVFLTGTVRSAASLTNAVTIAGKFVSANTKVVNMLSLQGSQQVILQVKVAEIDRTILKELTTNVTLNQIMPGGVGGSWLNGLLTFSTSSTISQTKFVSGTFDLQNRAIGPATFDALESQGLVKTLAEPTLMAISGEPATFLAGGKTPIPSGVSSTGQAICCDYVTFGIQLDFVPVVIDEGRISLNISTSVSELGSTVLIGGSNAYNITEKSAETTLELPSGGLVMMAGLLKDNVTNTIKGFPGLMDVPILGALFRSTNYQHDETELIITVTASLAKPTGANAPLSLPSDGFESGSDIDFYLLGRLHREYTNGDLPIWKDLLVGPFGYIME